MGKVPVDEAADDDGILTMASLIREGTRQDAKSGQNRSYFLRKVCVYAYTFNEISHTLLSRGCILLFTKCLRRRPRLEWQPPPILRAKDGDKAESNGHLC